MVNFSENICIICREFLAVEIDAYNQLNSIEPAIVPDEVILLILLWSEIAGCMQYSLYHILLANFIFLSTYGGTVVRTTSV